MQPDRQEVKDYGTCCTPMTYTVVITAESKQEAVRKFGVWKREMETRGLKININKTKLMVKNREPTVLKAKKGKVPMWGFRQRS